MKIFRYAILIILITAFVWPQSVFAAGEGFVKSTIAELLDIITFTILEFLRSALTRILTELGKILDSVLALDITYGGATVYIVWKVFRDICNSLFIVLFVFIAFGTIFNVLWKNPYYYASALKGVILAAILINFSLPIGQTVLWAGNQASIFVLGLFPKNESVGATMVTRLQVQKIVLLKNGPTAPLVPVTSVPLDKFAPGEQGTIKSWIEQTKSGQVDRSIPLQVMRNCIETSKRSPSQCYQAANGLIANDNLKAQEKNMAQQKRTIVHPAEFYEYWTTGKISKLYGPANLEQAVAELVNGLFSLVLLLTVILSFICIIAFMVIRIPMAWLLLSVSAPAVFTLGIPGAQSFRTWIRNLIGWSIFSPLYLFVIYIGLFLLSQSGNLTASFSDDKLPFFGGAIAQTLFFVISGFIFIYGAKWAMSTAFAFSSTAKSTFDAIGGKLGVSESSMYGIKTAARLSGATSVYESAKARAAAERANLAQLGRNVMDNRYLGVPQWMRPKSYEQKLAEKKAALGVYGADKEVADISAKQVTDEAGKQKSAMANMDKAAQLRYLNQMKNSPNRSAALAAREELLRRGKLSPEDQRKTRAMYPNEGARKAWDDKVKRAPGAAAREKKKEAEEKRADIIATVGGIETVDSSTMTELLGPYLYEKDGKTLRDPLKLSASDAAEKAAYIEALGLKDPSKLFDYLQSASSNKTASADKDLLAAFAPIIRKPENALELPDSFFDDPNSVAVLQKAVQQTYSGKKYQNAKNRLITAHPEKADIINNFIFP